MDGPNILNGRHTNLGNDNLETIRNEILDNNSGARGVNWTEISHTYNETKTNRSQTLTNIVTTQEYVSNPPTVTGKTDKNSDEPNFVTIYLASHSAKQAVKDLDSWLFEYLEMNDDTKEMVDLTKYLLYMASGKNYGQVDFDFEEFTTSSSSFNSSTTIVGSDLTEKVWNALKNLGYSDIAVAGAMGNIHHESGGFSPSAVEKGTSNGGIGLIQWSYGRRTKLETYAKSKNVSWTDENTQIEFLIAEISGQGPASNYADVRTKGYIGSEHITSTSTEWANSTTIEDSTLFFMRFFESPSDTSSYSTRTEWAHAYYEKYHQ